VIISTPGRICLFGEHQDYLGLPVIAMAISLRATIRGDKRTDKKVIIHKLDLGEKELFTLEDLTYTKSRDYFKSGINICKREGLSFSFGFECELSSQIPIQAGTSSSSAILVSWIYFLTQLADEPVKWSPQKIGELAYRAEVLEFNEPGGMMDQYSTAMGHLIYLESEPSVSIESINPNLGTIVLGDSKEAKDTMGILKRCCDLRMRIIKKIQLKNNQLTVHTLDENSNLSDLNLSEKNLVYGTIQNRDILKHALSELEKNELNHDIIGNLLTKHHTILRDTLKVSTSKIESMLDAALTAGALGGKINGSGGGGCMFAYAPTNPKLVAEAIERVGGKAYIIKSDEGTRIEI
jgi:galactokinase